MRFDKIDALEAAILGHVEQLLVEFAVDEAIFRGDFEDADQGVRGAGDAGAAVAVRLRKVAHRLAADEVIVEPAGIDELDGLRGHAFVVDIVSAEEAFAVEGLEAGIVDDIHEIGQHARVVAGGERAVGARFSAQRGTRGRDRGGEQRAQRVGCGVGAHQQRAVILLFDERRLAQIGERGDLVDGVLVEDGLGVEIGERSSGRGVGAVEAHAVGGLRARGKGLLILG